MKKFQAVFFDMDGTLVNSEPHWLAAETELMQRFDYPWTLADQQYCLGGPLTKVGKYMWELSGQKENPDWFKDELISRVSAKFESGIEFMPGALELLQELKGLGIPLGLVTASPAIMMNALIASLDQEYFDVAISGDDVAFTKPDPEGYLKAASQLGVDIKQSLILEDSHTGISAAQAAEAYVLGIPHIVEIAPADRLVLVKTLTGIDSRELENIFSQEEKEMVG